MANKKTRKEIFGEMKEIFEEMGKTEYVEFLTHQIELLDNKAISQKGMSKTQKENEALMEIVLEELKKYQGEVGITVSDLLRQSDVLFNYITENGKHISNPKLSALIKKLVDKKIVCRTTDKRTSYFHTVEE